MKTVFNLVDYQFPHLNLLDSYVEANDKINKDAIDANKDLIIKVLRDFGIKVTSIKAIVGPTVTLYEIVTKKTINYVELANAIGIGFDMLNVRIIKKSICKKCFGIEIPNEHPRIVPIQTLINSKDFQNTTMELPLVLGKTITNEVCMVDLAKAPHILMAGAVGQGKTVCLYNIITSLLYKKHPTELKFVLIDPKRIELSIFSPLEKHFLAKLPDGDDSIITSVSRAVETLHSLEMEVDFRYDLLKKAGCRNIMDYNMKFIERRLNSEKGHHFMPYIVIIIDEFGDLIMTAGKKVELPIIRIAQLAHAVGIHAIITTQRPTTNIISGPIKANFPARVAFRVASMFESRTVLDFTGAQQLIGRGDMLYLQGFYPARVQCGFIDESEIKSIVNFISEQEARSSFYELPKVKKNFQIKK